MPHETGIRDMKRRQFPMAYARKPGPLIGCAVQGSPSFGLSRRPERTGLPDFFGQAESRMPMAPGSCCRLGRGPGKEVSQDPLHARLSRLVASEEGLQIFKEIDGPPIVPGLMMKQP